MCTVEIRGNTHSLASFLDVWMIFVVDSMYPFSPMCIIVAQHAAMMAPARLPASVKQTQRHFATMDAAMMAIALLSASVQTTDRLTRRNVHTCESR